MSDLKEILLELELSLVNQDNRSSEEKLNELLSEDFIEYGSSGGIYTKEITISSLTAGPSPIYEIYDFEFVYLSEIYAQTRFKTDRVDLNGTRLTSLRSSVWRLTKGKWQMCFHQGTPIR
jgi:hypothetical protein